MPVTDPSRTAIGPETRSQEVPCAPAEKRGLLIVGCYKLLEGLFFIGVGVGALHLIDKNLGDVMMRVLNALPVDPEGRLVSLLMNKADLINAHDLRRIGGLAFLYAFTRMVEGTGLLLHKTWAEYFTVALTVLGLPIEVFELIKRATWFKAGALAVNLAILVYLLWVLKRARNRRGKTS